MTTDVEPRLPGRLAGILETVTQELADRLPGPGRATEIRAYVNAALLDLHRSVSTDSLPEMASRLAEHRLAAAARRNS